VAAGPGRGPDRVRVLSPLSNSRAGRCEGGTWRKGGTGSGLCIPRQLKKWTGLGSPVKREKKMLSVLGRTRPVKQALPAHAGIEKRGENWSLILGRSISGVGQGNPPVSLSRLPVRDIRSTVMKRTGHPPARKTVRGDKGWRPLKGGKKRRRILENCHDERPK